ncbi:MAG: hypothetical protein ABJF50_07820 [Paracoccaceae bacterium]
MSGAPASGPDEKFQDRVNRAAEGATVRPVVSVLPDWRAPFIMPFGIALAILMGMIAVIAVRVGMFHVTGSAMISDSPNVTMGIEALTALFASLLFFYVFPFRGAQYNFFQFLGVVVMISMMHNLVHKVPSVFALAFSPEWAQTVTTQTEPNSFYVRGQSVPFVPEPKTKKALPKVRRVG